MHNPFVIRQSLMVTMLGALLTLLVSFAVRAQDTGVSKTFPEQQKAEDISEQKPHVGVFGGYADTERDYDPAIEYGVDVGMQPYVPYGLGLEISRFTTDRDGDDQPNLNRNKLMLKGAYNFGGTMPVIRHSYAGLMAGAIFDESNNVYDIQFGYGPQLGFDIPIGAASTPDSRFTVGANANYLFITGDNPNSLGVNGVLKYWIQ